VLQPLLEAVVLTPPPRVRVTHPPHGVLRLPLREVLVHIAVDVVRMFVSESSGDRVTSRCRRWHDTATPNVVGPCGVGFTL
jgi:hypothetical protein